MFKKAGLWMAGFATLILLSGIIYLGISLKLILQGSIVEWISSSSNPRLSLWVISVLISSSLITLLKIGVKLPPIKPWAEALDRPFFTYLREFPVWVPVSILMLCGAGLIMTRPVCQSPTPLIDVTAPGGALIQYDGRSITAKPGANLTLKTTVDDGAVIFCSWSSTGPAVETIGPRSSCTTQAHLSNESGRGIITLTLSNSVCSVRSTEPLQIIIVP